MKKQFITSFTGGEQDVEVLRNVAERDGKGLSWHIRKAINIYIKELLEVDYNLSDVINPLNDLSNIEYDLVHGKATFNGKKLSDNEVLELINMATTTVNEFNNKF